MVHTFKIKNNKFKSFDSLRKDGLETIKHYRGRHYPTLPKTLDAIITQWMKNVSCAAGEKVFYKKTNGMGTRTYFAERLQDKTLVLKVKIQSKNEKQPKKTGTFQVLSSEEELCKILNDSLSAIRDTGKPLQAARYYKAMSKKFDVGRDRVSYVLNWINQNVTVDHPLPNPENSADDYDTDIDVDADHQHSDVNGDNDDNNDENEESNIINDNDEIDTDSEDASDLTLQRSSLDTPIQSLFQTGVTKNSTSHSSSTPQKRTNRALNSLTLWNNASGTFKPMSPLDRKQRRCRHLENE